MSIKTETRQIKFYTTTDGTEFTNILNAEFHQTKIEIADQLQNSDSELNYKTYANDLDVSDIGLLIRIAKILKENNQLG